MPWLMDETEEKLRRNELSRVLLDTLICQMTQQRLDDYEKLEQMLNEPPPPPVDEAALTAQATLTEPPAVVKNDLFIISFLAKVQ